MKDIFTKTIAINEAFKKWQTFQDKNLIRELAEMWQKHEDELREKLKQKQESKQIGLF